MYRLVSFTVQKLLVDAALDLTRLMSLTIATDQLTRFGQMAPFIGTWYLQAMFSEELDGAARTYPLGKNANGQVMYTADGHMGVYISSEHPNSMNEDDTTVANTAPLLETTAVGFLETDKLVVRDREFIAYGGTFDVDTEQQAIVHHVHHSVIAAAIGIDLVRHYTFGTNPTTGVETLELYSIIGTKKHGLLWERATPHVKA